MVIEKFGSAQEGRVCLLCERSVIALLLDSIRTIGDRAGLWNVIGAVGDRVVVFFIAGRAVGDR